MNIGEMNGVVEPPLIDESYDANQQLGLHALSEELFDSVLRPYEADDLLNIRLHEQSRVMRRNPDAAEFVGEVLQGDDDDSIIALSELIDEAWATARSGKEPAVATVLSYLTLITAVEDIHDRTLGQSAPNDRVNAIAHLLGRNLALRIPDERVPEFLISNQYIKQRVQEASLAADVDKPFLAVKMRIFNDILTSRIMGIAYASATGRQDSEPVSPEIIAQDSALIAEAFGHMRAARQYGLKLAYKRHYLGGSMILNEPAQMDETAVEHPENVHPLTLGSPAVADITHSKRTSFERLKRQVAKVESGAAGAYYGNIGTVAIFYLGESGELYVDRACNHSLKDIFVAQKRYAAYRALQADVLASYFDLTQAPHVVSRVKRIEPSAAMSPSGHESPDEVVGRLITPRVKVLREVREEPSSIKVSASYPSLRYHGVTWHRRTLPEGWSASPYALELAAAAGVTLESGETFVKAHYRGSQVLGEVVAHRLVEQSSSANNA